MDPKISTSGTTNAGQTAEGQNLSSTTNLNQTTNRNNTSRGSNQEGASFSGPGDQVNQQQTGYGNSNLG